MRRLRLAVPIAACAAALALGLPAGGGAMTDGVRAPAKPWMALIISNTFLGLQEEPSCSGAVVADGWVLTAAHCVSSSRGTVSPSSIRVLVGRDSRHAKKQGAAYGVARIVRMPGFKNLVANDAALIQLHDFVTSRWHALPLAFEASIVNQRGGVTFYGYGNVGWNSQDEGTGAGRLWKSPDGAFVRDPGCDGGFMCLKRTSDTRVMTGDSGGPWLRWAAGAWQLIGVQSVVRGLAPSEAGDPAGATSTLARLPDGRTMLEWVRDTAAIPTPRAGTIVHNPATRRAWLVGEDRYRRWIPSGSIYQCLTGSGHRVVNLPQISIDTIPDRVGTQAKCESVPVSIDVESNDAGRETARRLLAARPPIFLRGTAAHFKLLEDCYKAANQAKLRSGRAVARVNWERGCRAAAEDAIDRNDSAASFSLVRGFSALNGNIICGHYTVRLNGDQIGQLLSCGLISAYTFSGSCCWRVTWRLVGEKVRPYEQGLRLKETPSTSQVPVLPYGQQWTTRDFTCVSGPVNVVCRNRFGSGYSLSRETRKGWW